MIFEVSFETHVFLVEKTLFLLEVIGIFAMFTSGMYNHIRPLMVTGALLASGAAACFVPWNIEPAPERTVKPVCGIISKQAVL